jgi:hypothetical protein
MARVITRGQLGTFVAAFLASLALTTGARAISIEPAKTKSGELALRLQGRIVPGDTARLRAALEQQRPVLFVLNSPGGSVIEGRDMARLIRASGGRTMVPANGLCASACFMLFAAAGGKLVQPGAMVGVHSASVAGGNESLDTLGVTTLMARETAAYGVPPAITGRMVTTKPGQMAWLSQSELESMGVRIVGGEGAATRRVAPGSPGEAPSDWTRGFEHGRAGGAGASCTPPDKVGDAADWTLGCESGRRAGGSAVPARAGSAREPSRGVSDWSSGFDFGRGKSGDCGAPPEGVADPRDWTRGCESGRRAAARAGGGPGGGGG